MLELGTWMVLGLGAWLGRDARTRNMDGARTRSMAGEGC